MENPIYVVCTEGTLVASLGACRDREIAGLLAQVEERETGEAMEVVELDLFEPVVGDGPGLQLSFPYELLRPRGAAWWSGLVDKHDVAVDYDEQNYGMAVSDLPGVACVRCAG
jgi:hypothetical protein